MKQAVSRQLYAYWNQVRGDRIAPDRVDIDPAGIRNLLAHTFMLEVDRDGRFPLRLSATRINALFLRELKGTAFLDLWRRQDRGECQRLLFAILDDSAPAIAGACATAAGRPATEIEILLLPLRHFGRTHLRLLGSFAPADLPSWFGLVAAEPLELTSLRILRGEDLHASGPAPAAADQSADHARWPKATRYGHLTVYSNRR